MKKENNQKTISEKVVSEIEKKGIKTKPKFYFMIKSFLVVGLMFLLSLFILYLGSLIIFVLRANNILYFHGMGFFALRSVISSFPLYLVSLSVILIVLIEIIVVKFRFIYRKPLIYSLVAIIVLTLIGSFLIDKISFHQNFLNLAQKEKMPIMGRMYRNLGNIDIENAYFGEALKEEDGKWSIKLDSGEIFPLMVTEKTRGRRIYWEIEERDRILAVGEIKNGVLDVFAFRKIDNQFKFNER